MKRAFSGVMPSIAERLKKLDSIDDSNLMMGYRFLVKSRRARRGVRTTLKAGLKKVVAKKDKVSVSSHAAACKPASKKVLV